MPINLETILKQHQRKLLAGLETSRRLFENAEAKGDATEFEWLAVIESFLPTRYQASAAFVLDADGERSEFIDVVIHDRHFCPLLFEQGGQKYIPAESVYAAFEVKQDLSKSHIAYAAAKGKSVRRLRRTSVDIVHASGIASPRPLFPIITGILALESSWSPAMGTAFNEAIARTAGSETRLDLGCCLRHGAFDIDWTEGSPAPKLSEPDVSLMFFLMRLFGRLQRLGSVPAIDLAEYARPLEA